SRQSTVSSICPRKNGPIASSKKSSAFNRKQKASLPQLLADFHHLTRAMPTRMAPPDHFHGIVCYLLPGSVVGQQMPDFGVHGAPVRNTDVVFARAEKIFCVKPRRAHQWNATCQRLENTYRRHA